MFIYKKNLQYPVRIANPNPALAKVIISCFPAFGNCSILKRRCTVPIYLKNAA